MKLCTIIVVLQLLGFSTRLHGNSFGSISFSEENILGVFFCLEHRLQIPLGLSFISILHSLQILQQDMVYAISFNSNFLIASIVVLNCGCSDKGGGIRILLSLVVVVRQLPYG